MKSKLIAILFFWISFSGIDQIRSQQYQFSAEVEIADELKSLFNTEGRMFLFFSQNLHVEPRTQIWPNPGAKTYIFAKNLKDVNPENSIQIKEDGQWISTVNWTLKSLPNGTYNVQVLWDQDTKESRIDAPGNLFSTKQTVEITGDIHIKIKVNQQIQPRVVNEHELVKTVDMKSDILSTWWKKDVNLKASILLPHGYDASKSYAIRYNVAGYGGRYTRINRLTSNTEFMRWWTSSEAPQIINVFLDGEGPFGDSYQMDSENSGPYGQALIDELIPFIESKYRGTNDAKTRFVDGCSTGGWVSLGLQLYYPDTFNGVFSYSPDAVEFENYQLINIYKDKNAYVNEFNYPRPVMRTAMGEPMLALKDFIQYENVLGSSNSYLNSGGQFSAHTALYSPKGHNGLPMPLFDPLTGDIDQAVALFWKKYDFKVHAKKNWAKLGSKLQGKIFIWMGDMDNFYLNPATRVFGEFLKTTQDPISDAQIVFSPMEGHCSKFSSKKVLLQMKERLDKISN